MCCVSCSVMWYELYTCEMGKRKWRSRLCDRPDSNRVDLQDVPARVWKKLLLSEMRCHDHMVWKKELRYVNLHTGMPELTEQVLRSKVFLLGFNQTWDNLKIQNVKA